ncbi:MAG: DUF2975 domain-containing protein [Pseudomonadota bacterium]|nr:DUF2975 domain-containing protein [Pseudomonadota bacterium]
MQSPVADASPPTAPILSRVLSLGCLLLAAALPTLGVYIALANPQLVIDNLHLQVPRAAESLSIFQRIAIGVITTIPSLFQAYGLLSARMCFGSFARGEYFSLEVIRGLRGFAAGLFFWPVAAVLSRPVLTFVATLDATPGGHQVSVGIDTGQVFTLLFAGILWQIAGVMTRAKRLAEENAQFV